MRSLRLYGEFRAGEPARLTIRLADLVVTEWVLGCGSQLLTRAHELTTHLVLSLLHARSPALGPTSSPPASTSYDTPPPPSSATLYSFGYLSAHPRRAEPRAAWEIDARLAPHPPNHDDFIIRIIKPLSSVANLYAARGCVLPFDSDEKW